MRRATFILAVMAALAGCSSAVGVVPHEQPAQSQAALVDRLYMGRSIPGGGTVSDADWKRFVDEYVTPRFPDGLTVFHAQGQWRDGDGAITAESTFVLEITHPGGAAAERALQEIAAEYKRRFRQVAVLHTRAAVRMTVM
ncbi:MAG TPA: DUF3574 domain-containing protein [Longimicrobiales bacterium]|nr:DUF3574 domain-containing protein [Longimicrobiales bacterium]